VDDRGIAWLLVLTKGKAGGSWSAEARYD
jgi:hypothetical protein